MRIIILICFIAASCNITPEARNLCDKRVTTVLPGEWREMALPRDIKSQGDEYHPIWREFRKDSTAMITFDFHVERYLPSEENIQWNFHSSMKQKVRSYIEGKAKYVNDTIINIKGNDFGIVEAVYFDERNDRYVYQIDVTMFGRVNYLYIIGKSYEEDGASLRKDVFRMMNTLRWETLEVYTDCYKNDTLVFDYAKHDSVIARNIK